METLRASKISCQDSRVYKIKNASVCPCKMMNDRVVYLFGNLINCGESRGESVCGAIGKGERKRGKCDLV